MYYFLSGLLLCGLAISSCNGDDGDCGGFPVERVVGEIRGVEIEEIEGNKVVDSSFEKIENCYKSIPLYENYTDPHLERVYIADDGYYYLIISFLEVNDSWLAFRIDENGDFVSVFSYSPLSEFMVPNYN